MRNREESVRMNKLYYLTIYINKNAFMQIVLKKNSFLYLKFFIDHDEIFYISKFLTIESIISKRSSDYDIANNLIYF